MKLAAGLQGKKEREVEKGETERRAGKGRPPSPDPGATGRGTGWGWWRTGKDEELWWMKDSLVFTCQKSPRRQELPTSSTWGG